MYLVNKLSLSLLLSEKETGMGWERKEVGQGVDERRRK